MSERGWATLLVRGAGVVFFVIGLAGLVSLAVLLAFAMLSSFLDIEDYGFAGGYQFSYWISWGVPLLIKLAAGWYLLFRADWLIDRIACLAASGCRACGYPVDKANPNCPECGTPEPGEKSDP